MAKKARKTTKEGATRKAQKAARDLQKLEEQLALQRPIEEALLKNLGSLFDSSAAKAAEMVRTNLGGIKAPERRLFFLKELIKDFVRLKRVKVVRQTPLITILSFQCEKGSDGEGGRRRKPLETLDQRERRRTEPAYVYRPRVRNKKR